MNDVKFYKSKEKEGQLSIRIMRIKNKGARIFKDSFIFQ